MEPKKKKEKKVVISYTYNSIRLLLFVVAAAAAAALLAAVLSLLVYVCAYLVRVIISTSQCHISSINLRVVLLTVVVVRIDRERSRAFKLSQLIIVLTRETRHQFNFASKRDQRQPTVWNILSF